MEISKSELKRKAVHSLSFIYLLLYALLPRAVALGLMTTALIVVGGVEFIRLRRPEINYWFLNKFGGIHRTLEVTQPSGVFWMLLGCWLTMAIFASRSIVVPALGFVAFGDAVAALGGKKWGRHPWPENPAKSYEGSACFVLMATLVGSFFVRPHVALLGGLAAAWVEARPYPWRVRLWPSSRYVTFPNDNLSLPLLSGLALSMFNLALGKH